MATTESNTCQECKKEATEPFISSCCEGTFCKNCIDGVVGDKKPCPNCGSKNVESLGPKERRVSGYHVDMDASCVEECDWTGELKDLDDHEEECQFVEIECEVCEQNIKRKDTSKHLAQECPEREVTCQTCRKSFKLNNLTNHVKTCGELPSLVAGLKTKQEHQQQSIEQLEQQLQAQKKAIEGSQATTTAELKTSQEQQQQCLSQLQEKFQTQQEKCVVHSQEQQERDDSMKQSLQRLHTDLKKQQKDQQTRAEDQQSAHSRLESALKAQEDRTKQDIARLEKQQEQISEQQQKQEAKVTDRQKDISRLNTQQQNQQRSCDGTKAELKSQLTEQQAKLKEQDTLNSQLDTLLQEIKQQQIKQQAKITEQQSAITRLERQLQGRPGKAKGSGRLNQITDKMETMLRKEITKERIMWCGISIIIALPSLAIALHDNM